MSTDKIVLADLLNRGNAHREFNINVIESASPKFSSVTCVFDCSVNYLDQLDGVRHVPLPARDTSGFLYRWIVVNIRLIILLIRYRSVKVVFLHLPPLSQFLLCILGALSKADSELYLHGELAYLNFPNGKGQKIGAKLLRYVLQERRSTVVKHCLSQSIHTELRRLVSINSDLVRHDGYTLASASKPLPVKYDNESKLILVTGVVSRSKGFLHTNRLAENKHLASNYTIHVAGRSDGSLSASDFQERVVVSLSSVLIPQDEYMRLLTSSVALLIPQLFEERYQLVYSGLLETALKNCLPIITHRTKYLAEIERIYGPIGILVDSPDDLSSFKFDSLGPEDFAIFHGNLKKLNNVR